MGRGSAAHRREPAAASALQPRVGRAERTPAQQLLKDPFQSGTVLRSPEEPHPAPGIASAPDSRSFSSVRPELTPSKLPRDVSAIRPVNGRAIAGERDGDCRQGKPARGAHQTAGIERKRSTAQRVAPRDPAADKRRGEVPAREIRRREWKPRKSIAWQRLGRNEGEFLSQSLVRGAPERL